jgi:hypothetical protein
MTLDEIEPDEDGRLIATLISDTGLLATIPLELLPPGARLNQVIVAEFRLDETLTSERKRRVIELQHRLFNREGE